MTVGQIVRCWSNFCRRMVCMLGPGSTLHFEKSGLTVSVEAEVLGEGGFSTVYKATTQNMSSKKYAVKKVVVQTDEIKRNILAEIMFLNEFRHPNIIKLVDSVDVRDKGNNRVICLLFPLIARGSLRHVLNLRSKGVDRSKLDLQQIMRDFKSICSAFNYMHTLTPVSYIHQDIKPENVLISDDGTPLLTDFGSVRPAKIFIDSRNKALTVADEASQFCTLPYRAPELFDPPTNVTLDSRTDVWGIGCLLFAWWFNYSPFECEFTAGNQAHVVECSYSRVLAKLPTPQKPSKDDNFIIHIVEWMLEHDMSKRPFCSDVMARISNVENSSSNI